ncbi:type VI secretion system baseplate subunit TssF [Spartinivicinus poritis]|uniref:Type VI secretion system baseplate subunit TssF n=1 Tax=Spartinivicinus poritis TaxID=2994640 RepID=A0ABT5UA42_9GAMM|nr:type VI secretion system baseplate subunit TssF [Spartinivicinus sp. A2-2]MDE1463250.1 type VI secretion system baseplate subunit TssF [Spartinivicinus sp. A2-2]
MAFNKYFQDELAAVRELGKEFAEKNPRLAPFLSVREQDPDVERLLEGFAFLTGRLRQKLDDELPELSHSVMSLLWPNFLKPVPSMSIIQFRPDSSISDKYPIERGAKVASSPVDGTRCTFKIAYDIDLYPFALTNLNYRQQAVGSSIQLDFQLAGNAVLSEIDLDYLRLFLHGDFNISLTLYHLFIRHVTKIEFVLKNDEETVALQLDKSAVYPVGFAENEALLPYSDNTFLGYRLIQEYFSLPEKYSFIDIRQLNNLYQNESISDLLQQAKQFSINVYFDQSIERQNVPKKENIQLFCTPVVNLFNHDATPLRMDQRRTEYRVQPSGDNPLHYEIYSIDKVVGWGHSDRLRRDYKPFESFDHATSLGGSQQDIYYRTRLKSSVTLHGVDTYLSFVSHNDEDLSPQAETISVDLTCSNRDLPQKLSIGDIKQTMGETPEFAPFSNITKVTHSFTPPLDKGFHWRVISNMSLNYVSLVNVAALRSVLSTYDYRSYYDRQYAKVSKSRLEGIEEIEHFNIDRLYKGLPIRGIKTRLHLRESKFANEGDMYQFASVLNEFFALYVSLNSFHMLEVVGIENGEIYQWEARIGQQPIL